MARAAAAPVPILLSTRDAILDAAERRFADRGFDGASVREIASDAGLKNQASLYHYFRSKRTLYEAVLARGVASLVQLVAASERERAAAASLADAGAYLDGVIDYLIEHPHLARLIQGAGLDESEYVREAVGRLLRPLYAQGLRVLSEAGGPWRPSEIPHLAAGLYHLIFGYFANPTLMRVVLREDPRSVAALARQRRFVKAAVARLIVGEAVSDSASQRVARTARHTPSVDKLTG